MKKEVNPNRIEKHHITPKCLLKHKDKAFVDRDDNIAKLPHYQHEKAHTWLFMLLGDACGTGIVSVYYSMVRGQWYVDMTGKTCKNRHTEESKNKIREYHIGRKLPEETKKKIKETHKGKIISQETRIKMGERRRGKKHSEDTLEKMRGKHTTRCFCCGIMYNSIREAIESLGIKRRKFENIMKDPEEPDFFYLADGEELSDNILNKDHSFNPERFIKRKRPTKEAIEKMRNSKLGKPNKRAKKCSCNDIVYSSIMEAAKYSPMGYGQIRRRCNDPNNPDFFYIDKTV